MSFSCRPVTGPSMRWRPNAASYFFTTRSYAPAHFVMQHFILPREGYYPFSNLRGRARIRVYICLKVQGMVYRKLFISVFLANGSDQGLLPGCTFSALSTNPSATWKGDIPFLIFSNSNPFFSRRISRPTRNRPIEFIHNNISVGKPWGDVCTFFPRFCARGRWRRHPSSNCRQPLDFLGARSRVFQSIVSTKDRIPSRTNPHPPWVAQLEVFSTMDSTFERQKLCKSIW